MSLASLLYVDYVLLVAIILHQLLFTNPVFPTLPRKIPSIFPVKVTYKTSTKKNAKAKTKKLTYTMKVAKASVALSGASEVKVGSTTKLTTTKKASDRAKITYTSSDASVATVGTDGTVTGVKAGKATITAKLTIGKDSSTATYEITVVDSAAKKIESVTATSVKTLEVKFDGDVKDTATGKFKVSRAGTDVAMAAKWSDDNTSAILTSESALQAGTYTVTYGDMTGTVTVQAQKATKINVLTTKVGLGNNLGSDMRVYYTVLDQYGNDMGISSNKLTINATNMSKNHSVGYGTNANKTNTYFTVSTNQVTDAIGDKIAVVAYLTSDVSVSVSTTLEIANIYTKDFTFGEPDKGKDAHIFVDQTDYRYSLPYTAADSEGNKVLLNKTAPNVLGSTATTNNITFVSSNTATINPQNFKIDADGKITFTTGSYASTVTITALNTVTGETTKIDVTVGKKPQLASLDVTDVTIPRYADEAKAEIVGHDQYGDVISPLNLANMNLSTLFTLNGSAASNATTATVTKDGKYVEFKNLANTASGTVGSKFNIIFISKVDPSKTSTANIIIGDETVPSYFKVDSSAVDTLFAGATGDIKVTAYDNYDKEVTDDNDINYVVTWGGKVDVTTVGAITAKNYVPITVEADAISGSSDNGTVTINLQAYNYDKHRWDDVESKVVSVVVSNVANDFIVTTDKDNYASGDKINVELKAYNGNDFLNNFNATVAATVKTIKADKTNAVDTKTENITFKNGVATTTVDAKAAVKYVYVDVEAATATGNVVVSNNKSGEVSVDAASTTTKYGVAVSGSAITVTAQNGVGETVTGYAGNKAITIKVEKKDGKFTDDVTDTYINDKAPIVTFVNGQIVINTKVAIPTSDGNRYTVTITEQNGTFTGSTDVK